MTACFNFRALRLLPLILIATFTWVAAADLDADGVDDSIDLCVTTDLGGPVPTGTLCSGCMGDDQTILGCNASDILACKPGPNKRQYEMGISAQVQKMFGKQKGWAAKCGCGDPADSDGDGALNCVDQCPMDAEKTTEGQCGCGVAEDDSDGDGAPDCVDACPNNPGSTQIGPFGCGESTSGEIIAGQPLALKLDAAAFTIPADALRPGVEVVFAEVDPALLNTPPTTAGESALTPFYVLTFSNSGLAESLLTLTLDIPTAVTTGFFVRLDIYGGVATDDVADTGWVTEIGDYDPVQSQISVDLGASASSIFIAVVGSDSALQNTSTGYAEPASTNNSVERLMYSAATASTSLPPLWESHGWVVACDPAQFTRVFQSGCGFLDPDLYPMLDDLGDKLLASDQKMTGLFLNRGLIDTWSVSQMDRANLPYRVYDPAGRSDATAGQDGSAPRYFLAWVLPDTTDDTLGYYSSTTRAMYVDQFEGDDTVIHEQMHAFQRYRVTSIFGQKKQKWITEGLAKAVEPFAPSGDGDGPGFRSGSWRDWAIPLHEDTETVEYQTAEFWLSEDATLSSLWDVYQTMSFQDEYTDSNKYVLADEALTFVGLAGLSEGYTDLILLRNSQLDYPHCLPVDLDCDGATCSEAVDITPISASCLDMIVDFPDPPASCPNVTPEITVELITDPNPGAKLIVDGTVHEANTPVGFSGTGRIWAMNTDKEGDPSPLTAQLEFANNAPCYVQPLYQSISARVDTDIRTYGLGESTLTSPTNERIVRTYESFDDLGTGYISFYQDNNFVDTNTRDYSVGPLGLDPWGTSVSSISEFDSNTSSYYAGTGDASVSSDTDGTSKTLVTTGQTTTLSTVIIPGTSSSRTAGYSRAGGRYNYATNDVPAELTLNWDCSMSFAGVKIADLQSGVIEEVLLNASKNGGTWECGTRTWTVPAGKEIQVSISSVYTVGRWFGDSFYGESQDAGGAFEINLRALVD